MLFHFSPPQVKEKKTHIRTPKPPFIDFSIFKSSTVRMFILFSSVASFGIYTPIFFMSLHGYQEGYDVQDLVLLQTFLGLSIAFGIVLSAYAIKKGGQLSYRKITITRQHICQVCLCVPFNEDEIDSIARDSYSRMSMNFHVHGIHIRHCCF